jgi:hypothetical protein
MTMPAGAVTRAALDMPGAVFEIYAPPKKGKTTALLRFLPRAVCVGIKSAIELVAQNTCGFKPAWIVEGITHLPGFIAWLDWFVGHGYHKQYQHLLVDDWSHICNTSMPLFAAERPGDRFWAFRRLDECLDIAANKIRETGMIVGLSAHETAPNPEKKQIGGPEVPSRNQLQSMPGWADFVARMDTDPSYLDPLWRRTFQVDVQNDQWITGDRFNIAWWSTPANLREIVRASKSGYALPRFPGLEWQEDWAESVCAGVLKGIPIEHLYAETYGAFGKNAAPETPGELHVQWAIQDGIARAVIKKYHAGGVLGRLRAVQAAAVASAPPPPPPPPAAAPAPPGPPVPPK